MNTKTTITLLIVLLLAVGAFTYVKGTQKGAKSDSALSGQQNQQNQSANAINNGQGISASFSCTDNSYFIAEFPNAESLQIIVNGNIIQTLPRVEGTGQRFENNTHLYVFAGEEATVLYKAEKKTAICQQPQDPNNAPVNFGDRGEGGAGFQNTNGTGSTTTIDTTNRPDFTTIVSESLVGIWKSTTDAKFIREFAKNGTVIDMYDGKKVTTGTWKVFMSEKPLKVTFPLERETIYVQMIASGAKGETFTFKLGKLTPDELQLTYMERGGVNTFVRVK